MDYHENNSISRYDVVFKVPNERLAQAGMARLVGKLGKNCSIPKPVQHLKSVECGVAACIWASL